MWIFSDTAQALMAVGIFLAVIDVLVFGFATLFLTLIGLAMLSTGILINVGVLSSEVSSILISMTILTTLFGVLLWKPLKNLQSKQATKKVKTDLTGMSFHLEQDVSPSSPASHQYSGVQWKVESEAEISAGTEVVVIELQVGVMKVKAKD